MINRKNALILTVVTAVLIIAGSLSLVFSESTAAADISDGDFNYTIIDGGVAVASYAGTDTDLIIPSQVTSENTTYDVIEIGVRGFYNNKIIKTITLPTSVKTIGLQAFSGCTALSNINLVNVNIIESTAFQNCTSLTTIDIGAVTFIGTSVFSGCSGLTSITIPSSVTSIGNNAFQNCTNLTSITIPSSVTSIGNNAFYGCSGLTSITIPSSVTSIGSNAFRNCTTLTIIDLGAVTSIGSTAFQSCTSLTSITIPSSVTSIGSSAFQSCTSLTSITIPSSVTSIGSSAFYGCSGLTSITIPSSVTSIGSATFQGCTSLTSITIPSSVTSITANMFQNCTSLTSITIPSSVTLIDMNAFYGCSGLTSITIPSLVTSIGSSAFQNCTSLKIAYISMQILNLNWNIFTGCTSFETLYVGPITSVTGTALGSVVVLDRWIIPLHTPASLIAIDSDPWSFSPALNASNVTITLDGPEWLTVNADGTISGTPPALADGVNRQDYTVALTYTKDGYLGSAQVFTLTVMAPEPEPELIVSNDPSISDINAGDPWSYTPNVNASDVTITVTGADWLTVTDDTISGISPKSSETTQWIITITYAKEGYISASQTFTLNVLAEVEPVEPTPEEPNDDGTDNGSKNLLDRIIDFILGIWNGFIDFVVGVWNTIITFFRGLFQ